MKNSSYSITESKILIEDLELNVSVGLLPEEKKAPQRILVSMELFLQEDYIETATKDTIVDYAEICMALKEWETAPHTELLETLAHRASMIALSYHSVTKTRIHIRKPDIIDRTEAVGIFLKAKNRYK